MAPRKPFPNFADLRREHVTAHRTKLTTRQKKLRAGPANVMQGVAERRKTLRGRLQLWANRKSESAHDSAADKATRFNLDNKLQTAIDNFDAATIHPPNGFFDELQRLHNRIDVPIGGDPPEKDARIVRYNQAEAKIEQNGKRAFQDATDALDLIVKQFQAFK